MAFFKKKNSAAKAPEAAATSAVPAAASDESVQSSKAKKDKGGKKNARDMMSSVLQESVTESIIENGFAQNKNFIHNGKYVGLFFNTEDIGYLNRRTAKNEDKGSLIEQINSGRICVLITDELMDCESMVIVPNSETVECMDEYALLNELEYPLCYVSPEGDVDILETKLPFSDIRDLVREGGKVSVALGGDEEDIYVDDEPAGNPLPEYEDDIPEDVEDDSPFAGDDGFDDTGYDDSSENWSGEDYSGFSDEPPLEDEGDFYGDEAEEEDVEISQEEFEQAMTRKLYSDDLGLEITTQAFDTQFLHTNSFVPFSENRGEGWLNQYLEQMSRDANADLRRMHQDNLLKMRTTYFNMVSMYAADVAKELDYKDPKTDYGKHFQLLEELKAQEDETLDMKVSDRRAELADNWERRLAEVGQAAASAATQQYRERHQKQHEDAVHRVELDVRARVMDEYQESVRKMNDERREEAAKRLDMGINSALSEVSRMYMTLLDEEKQRWNEYQKAMLEFIDVNRKDEISRVRVLAEEQRQSERADAVMAECTAKMEQQAIEFESRRKALADELEQTRRRAQEEAAKKEQEYRDGLRQATADHETMQGRIDNLIHDLGAIDDKKENQYRAQLDALVAEREAFSQKYDHLADMVKKERMMVVTLATVGIVAALVIGFVAGEFVNIKGKGAVAQQGVSQNLEQQLDDIEFDMPEGWDYEITEDGKVTITRADVDGEESLPQTLSE